ncbi:hypothetical protein NW762_006065 [Fusarium torreyae]|uniref:Altered inheritance of mitochondria protein 11 n=1 Tax=Fusarium torreyae TaxID=1237075 RepID=A0A9W8S2S5_9HYPO|nr:hypothetical protein NW762_006065 [Fusarium torreyae]
MSNSLNTPAPQNSQETISPRPSQPPTPSPWARPFRQVGLLLTGAGFLAASVAISRRSVLRMRRESFPKFYSSNRHPVKVDSSDRSLLAVQALGLATLNVMSFGIMLVGGISWAFDLSSITELRERTQAAIRRPGLVNPEDEKAMEEMMEDLMGKLGMEKPQLPKKSSDDPKGDEN